MAQFVRFLIGGAAVTAFYMAVYSLIALVVHLHPQIANLAAYLVALASGYLIHSQWSFRDHGTDRTPATRVRFVAVAVITFVVNSFWVWLVYSRMHLSRAAPMIPILLVTPAVTFLLNRRWVFR